MTVLPDWTPMTYIASAPQSFVPRPQPPQAKYPPLQKIGEWTVVDHWQDVLGGLVLKLWRRADHVQIASLPPNAPRIVKQLYTAEGQLKMLRGDYSFAPAALEAWAEFCTPPSDQH